MSDNIERWSSAEMMLHAARGAGKIDLWGARGWTLVSALEIDAMACALVVFGLEPIRPGSQPPASKIPYSTGERA